MAWTIGQTPDVYTLPEVKIAVDGASWLADAAVTSFTVERELVASVVPGTLRSRGGMSVGDASVSIINEGAPVTPWSADLDRLVSTDIPAARLYAEDEAGEVYPFGSWVLDPVSGSLAARETTIDLLEAQYAARKKAQALQPYGSDPFTENAPVDPCWIVGGLAAQAGFNAVPPPATTTFLDVPMYGAFQASPAFGGSPLYDVGGETPGWEVLPGDVAVGGANGTHMVAVASAGNAWASILLRTGQKVTVTLNVVGTVHVLDYANGWQLRIVNDPDTGTHQLAVCNNNNGVFTTPVTFAGQQSDDWPNRVEIEMQRTWDVQSEQWLNLQARIRSAPDATWSSWATDSTDHAPLAIGLEIIYVLGGAEQVETGIVDPDPGQFAAVQMTANDPLPEQWIPSKAHLKPLGGDVGLPWVPATDDVWTSIRDVCSACLGAAVLGRDGTLRVSDRDDLAGANSTGDVVLIDEEWSDLAWTLDPNDRVDRLEVTFTPPLVRKADIGSTTLAPEAWRASEVITVPPLSTVTIPAALESTAAVGMFKNFIIPSSPDESWSQSSNIFPFSNPEGSGFPLAATSVRTTMTQTSATTATVQIRNTTSSTVYLVDGNGDPGLILRARTVATFETPHVLEVGAPAADAVNPLTVDLTPWVQRETDAAAVLAYLWGRLSGNGLWKANGVRCRLDWSHELTRVLRLLHPDTGLEVKALVTKLGYGGQAGEITQALDLVLLPWTWADFDALTATTPALDTWAEFDTANAGRSWTDFDADPLWTP